MLDRIGGFMSDVGVIVRAHHERWDGTGYPDGLAREAIPVEARIITACDSWNAMRTNRPYRSAMSVEAAREEITRGTGTQFDPVSADALLAVTPASTSQPNCQSPAEPRGRIHAAPLKDARDPAVA